MQIHYQVGFMKARNQKTKEILNHLLKDTGLNSTVENNCGVYLGAIYWDFMVEDEQVLELNNKFNNKLAELLANKIILGGFAGTKLAPVS